MVDENNELLTINSYLPEFPSEVENYFVESYGYDHWNRIKRQLVLPSKSTTVRVNTLKTCISTLKKELEESLNCNQDQPEYRKGFTVQQHDILPDILSIESLEPIDKNLTPNPNLKDVIVDRLCGEAVLKGSDIYVRGVYSTSPGLQENDIVNLWVDLEHKSTRACPISSYEGKRIFIGLGKSELGRNALFAAESGLGFHVLQRVCSDAPSLNGKLSGKMYLQHLPSAVIAHVLDPQPNDTIIDLCAAPGGKTSHVAARIKNTGILISCDRSRRKAQALQKLQVDLGLTCMTPLKMDSTQAVLPIEKQKNVPMSVDEILRDARANQKSTQKLLQIDGFYPETFDKVLLDPPCSALGLRPRLVHSLTLNELDMYSKIQKNLLWSALYLLKPNGILVYSTCTINPKENEQMVRYALDNYPLELLSQEPYHLGEYGLLNQTLTKEEAEKVQRFDPTAKIDTMGFFCAKFRKIQSVKTKNLPNPSKKLKTNI